MVFDRLQEKPNPYPLKGGQQALLGQQRLSTKAFPQECPLSILPVSRSAC